MLNEIDYIRNNSIGVGIGLLLFGVLLSVYCVMLMMWMGGGWELLVRACVCVCVCVFVCVWKTGSW